MIFIYIPRSESPSQVLLIVLGWLLEILKETPKDNYWSDIVLAYDAMCKLDRMKLCQKALPLPKPFDEMWKCVTKGKEIKEFVSLKKANIYHKTCTAKISLQIYDYNHTMGIQ